MTDERKAPEDTIDRGEQDGPDRTGDPAARAEAAARRRRRPRTRNRLSPHFVIEEFDCNDGTRVKKGRARTYEYLCNVWLEPMREKFGPCTVHSGYRTPGYNARVGGASRSIHVNDFHPDDDVAADVSFARGTPQQWHAEARRIRESDKRNGRGGLGLYVRSGFVHIDTRDYRADWTG